MTDEEKKQPDQNTTETDAPNQPPEQDATTVGTTAASTDAADAEESVNPVVGNIVLTMLGIYAIALSLLALDTVFGWGWFSPPRQEIISE